MILKVFNRFYVWFLPVFFTAYAVSYGSTSDLREESINSIKAIVGDEIITQGDVVKRAAVALREAQERYQEKEFFEKADEILKETLDELINRKVLIKEAQKLFGTDEMQMKEVEKDLDSFMKGAVKNVGSLSKYYEIAEAQGINPLEKKNELKEDIMIDKIMKENVYNKVKVQPKLLRRYYVENVDEFRQKKEVSLRQIMIKFSAHDNDREKTLSLAQQIRKRLEKGEDFATLAKQYSEGPNAENGGLLSFEEVNEMRKDLRDAVYQLKDNERSGIIASPVGYHIFKMELIKPEKVQEFEEVQEDIYKKIYREEISRLKNQYLNSLKSGMFVKVFR
ncbi:MAG: peptidyl-prolyl cis-trans isomerase [Candidatus Brocadia fulgida]|uniref:peptidylprolyl isomerase n=1 Tax=Candidatus Brocadia fulgida TaxID=380242 RepID=A0A0M2UVK4_9BACT|nr:MAG: peptidyl-prolyl cis-trans isomerase [Candidatus Brocadia fulgida]